MKVLFICSGNSGKANVIIENQANSLKSNGVDVDFYLIKGSGVLGYLSNIFALKRFLKNKNYDILHAHYSYSAFVASFSNKTPLVVSLMGSDVYTGGWQMWMIKMLIKKRWVFTIAKSKDLAEKVGENYCSVIPNGVDIETFYPISKDIAKQRLGLDLSKRYLFFAANPARPEKNFNLAKQAYDNVKSDGFVLVKMENIPHNDVPLWMNASDVILLSSLWEGSPNVIKEAMACNKPIVCTDVGDVSWLFGNEPGYFIGGFTPDNFTKNLIQACQFAKDNESTNGRQRIIDLGLDADFVAKRIKKVYESIIKA